jgi:3-dehydroquinate synthase
MRKVTVDLGDRSYSILINYNSIDRLGIEIRDLLQPSQVVVISDRTVAALYSERLLKSLSNAGVRTTCITFPAGESSKCLSEYARILDQMIEAGMDRKSAVVALGGGVTGDLVGFASASYMRGIAYIQAPTTLLAMVDSSVGGKTGIDHRLGKNLIGAFYQPRLVFVDPMTLDTLPAVEFRSGMAEVVKHGVIRDADYFALLEEKADAIMKRDPETIEYVIARSCQIKAEVVGGDEREAGLRAILNFGHTAGHAIEALCDYKGYRHGEAVAIGMMIASQIAHEVCGFSRQDVDRLHDLLRRMGLPTDLSENQKLSSVAILNAMYGDKKTEHRTLRFVLPRQIGATRIEKINDDNLIKRAIDAVRK